MSDELGGQAVPEPVFIDDPVMCEDGCGKPRGSFACKIRHIQVNTGWAKSAND